ncbi:MAG: alpha/beta hydrolase-fold protein [Planctomycetota bacterium]
MPNRTLAAAALLTLALAPATVQADTYTVRLDPSVATANQSGRLILFFATESLPQQRRVQPIQAPFFSKPQPIASMDVEDWKPGTTITIENPTIVWPGPLEDIEGEVRVQALLDVDNTERSHRAGPGNLVSDMMTIKLTRELDESISLNLTERLEPEELPENTDRLHWLTMKSPTLSSFAGHDVYHRAGLILPADFEEDPKRTWPAVYHIPGYGGRHTMASYYVRAADNLPPAVHIFLDAEAPLGHHGFVDSANNGPRATAFIEEFIPYLERSYRLRAEAKARIVTGHSSGGWSSLWLQLKYPDTFGACWSSAPDPVCFTEFGVVNIYDDANMFANGDGEKHPSMRRTYRDGRSLVRMTIEEENGMEWAIQPDGASGQQWDAWEAMFSPRNPKTNLPKPLYDPRTGVIDKDVANAWKPFDIHLLVRENWDQYGPIMAKRVRLVCGDVDSFYLERAVKELKATFDARRGDMAGDGYIELIPGADHGGAAAQSRQRFRDEMTAYLEGIDE